MFYFIFIPVVHCCPFYEIRNVFENRKIFFNISLVSQLRPSVLIVWSPIKSSNIAEEELKSSWNFLRFLALFRPSLFTVEAQVMKCFHVKSRLETEQDLRSKSKVETSRCLLYRCWLRKKGFKLQEYENKGQNSAAAR